MLPDWITITSPSRELVEALAPIPGVKFELDRLAQPKAVRVHRSVTPLHSAIWPFPDGAVVPDSPGVVTFDRKSYLRDYQLTDLPFLLFRHASILGYEMRL